MISTLHVHTSINPAVTVSCQFDNVRLHQHDWPLHRNTTWKRLEVCWTFAAALGHITSEVWGGSLAFGCSKVTKYKAKLYFVNWITKILKARARFSATCSLVFLIFLICVEHFTLFAVNKSFQKLANRKLSLYTHYILDSFSCRHEKLSSIVWTPIRYVTLHFRDQRGAASLRYRNSAAKTVLMRVQKPYPVWFSCRRKSYMA